MTPQDDFGERGHGRRKVLLVTLLFICLVFVIVSAVIVLSVVQTSGTADDQNPEIHFETAARLIKLFKNNLNVVRCQIKLVCYSFTLVANILKPLNDLVVASKNVNCTC
jgi:hypothetical protein